MAELIKQYGSKGANIDALRRHFHVSAPQQEQGRAAVPGIDYVPPLGAVSVVVPARVPRHHANQLAAVGYAPWAAQVQARAPQASREGDSGVPPPSPLKGLAGGVAVAAVGGVAVAVLVVVVALAVSAA